MTRGGLAFLVALIMLHCTSLGGDQRSIALDWRDVLAMPDCMSGPQAAVRTNCDNVDVDSDGDVDLLDTADFQLAYDANQPNYIDHIDDLFAAATIGGSYDIAPGVYDLTMRTGGGDDLVFSESMDLFPLGAVTITGAGQHQVLFTDDGAPTTHIVGDSAGAATVTFAEMANDVRVTSQSAAINVTLHYCRFVDSLGNGLSVSNQPAGPISVTLYSPEVAYNAHDGLSLTSGVYDFPATLYVFDPQIHDNVNPSPAGDGITAHEPQHRVFVWRGAIYNNGKGGIVNVNGSSTFVVGTHLHNNGTATTELGNIYQDGGILVLRNVRFTGANGSLNARSHVDTTGGCAVDCADCYFGQPATGGIRQAALWLRNVSTFHVTRCLFANDSTVGNSAAIDIDTGTGVIDGCTIHNMYNAIELNSAAVRIERCIITNCTRFGVVIGTGAPSGAYAQMLSLGNLLYDNAINFYDSNGGGTASQLRPVDLTVDPQLIDPAAGDFRPSPVAPVVFPDGNYWGALAPHAPAP